MRIISGEFRSRKLLSPPDAETTRPIPDRVKESLFGLLRGHVEGASVFDGFAGSGAFGLEAVSRGASRCVFVEKDRAAGALLKRNIELLDAGDRCELIVGDALGPGALARCPRPATIVFLDPPYPLVRDIVGWKRVRSQLERLIACLSDDGYAMLRTPWPFVQLVDEEGKDASDGGDAREEGRGKRRGREDGRKGKRDRGERGKERRSPQGGEEEVWSIENRREEDLTGLSEAEIEAIDAAEADALAEAAEKKKLQKIFPDLAIPGAAGPETHEYGTMAVHLYQRTR